MKLKKIALFVISLVLSASCVATSACAGFLGSDNSTSHPEQSEGGSTEGGNDQGGTDQGGTDQGGTDQGGTDQGGSDQGGTDQGGSDQGGTDQGGGNEGGSTEGGNTEGGDVAEEKITITFKNGDTIVSTSKIDKGTCGQAYALVVDGYYVSGWYKTADFSGEPYDFTQPFAEDTTLYAKLVAVENTITYASSASESAAFEWKDSTAAAAKVEYKLSSAGSYTSADSELIRQLSSTTARVDIVGLKGNASYDFRITTSDKEVIDFENVTISAYDRSGYAHFKKSGVGAYNDDGTLKSNAQVIYVSEANKNTVKATLNG